MKPFLIATAVAALALITFFQFPGHTWLQQDSQIYVPILEHLRDPAVLRNDVLVQRPHVSFTLYDETALALRHITGLSFREVLAAEQLVTRALGIWGLYLMAAAAGLAPLPALLVAAIVSLGTLIAGPQVLTFEYEPIPRGFAVLLQLFAVGLVARGRYMSAGLIGAAGFLIHPPTVYPFWAIYFVLALWPSKPELMKRHIYGLLAMLSGIVVLYFAAQFQIGAKEGQEFFTKLSPLQEKLQRMRASYVWVSMWGPQAAAHYAIVTAILAAAFWRIRRRLPFDLGLFLAGVPAIGLLSIPLSYFLLERVGWALLPQFQPMRALLFVVLAMQFVTAVAAVGAGVKHRWAEACGWFVLAYAAPLVPRFDALPGGPRVAALALLAALATLAMWLAVRPRWRAAVLVVALAGFWIVPGIGGVRNYPHWHTPELAQLSGWARAHTSRDAVFLFADTPKTLDSGIFRSEALRAVYVDWKGGGQVNYLKELGEQWWFRWQQTLAAGFRPTDMARYNALGIQYVVLRPEHRLADRATLFENGKYLVYAAK
jgi:hypothetical protein